MQGRDERTQSGEAFFSFKKKRKKKRKEAAEVFLEVNLCMDGKISRESITAVRAAGERREEGRVPVGSLFCLFHSDGSSATCFSFT